MSNMRIPVRLIPNRVSHPSGALPTLQLIHTTGSPYHDDPP
jgi:hypothetical protein